MNLKKGIVSFVSAIAIFASVVPATSFASEKTTPTIEVSKVSKKQVSDAKEMINVIEEIDRSKLNMDNLSKNKQTDIDRLSEEAQQFYYIFEQAVSENGNNVEQALTTLATYYQSTNSGNVVSTPQESKTDVSLASLGSVKEYFFQTKQ